MTDNSAKADNHRKLLIHRALWRKIEKHRHKLEAHARLSPLHAAAVQKLLGADK